ncbi:NFACT RNA binding domain-containing protein [Lactobacillus sp. 3B(2020)]|uniref:NFACT RNA binding domain-containing protein n=1 Tax=Lactobacillus sp. 3B(2020) TaxID=2695882 RepID=UPI0015DD697E|nr:NFACT RNA binding domain-containing protein [Lactobacillus sp. 3B(2020)]QLL69928.1 DUF814 domain-containing protein [Lactobacillus sp. 3B(2020)]
MAFDGFFTHAMVVELNQFLTSGRVMRVNQPYPNEMIMVIRAHRKNQRLLISANPAYPRFQLTKIPYQNPAVPSNFTMTMRKYLEGAILTKIAQVENDRVVTFHFTTRDELGDTEALVLYVEIMARHSNATLVNQNTGKVIDALKHVGSDQNRFRTILPGSTWRMPPKQERTNPYLPNSKYPTLVKTYSEVGDLAHQLQATYQGLSTKLAQELANRLLASDNLPQTYTEFLKAFDHPEPTLVEFTNGKQDFWALKPMPTPITQINNFKSLSALLDHFYAHKAEHDRTKELAGQVLKIVNTEIKKDQRKIKKLQKELAAADQADFYRIRGEILTTYLGQVKPGATKITLPNFYDENHPLEIELSPELSPSRNAQRYFTRYNKLKASIEYDHEQLRLTQAELDYLTGIVSQIAVAAPKDVQEIKIELVEQGYLKPHHRKGKKQRKVPAAKPSEYYATDGTLILVGKNNRQNDRLSFKIANKNDLWFHVKDIPGSHVVIRDANPSQQTIMEAAQIAAYFSKGQNSTHVQVDYLPIKALHKPSGAKPGFVTFRGQTTLTVDPVAPRSINSKNQ